MAAITEIGMFAIICRIKWLATLSFKRHEVIIPFALSDIEMGKKLVSNV